MGNTTELLEKLHAIRREAERWGFDAPEKLGVLDYEARAMVAVRTSTERLTFVGTKGGKLWVHAWGATHSGTLHDISMLPWVEGGPEPSIDALAVVQDTGPTIAVGTRGSGAWLVPVSGIDIDREAVCLIPGTEGTRIRALLFDDPSRTLFVSTRCGRLVAYHVDSRAHSDLLLPWRVTDMAVDVGSPTLDAPRPDLLFLSTNVGSLYRIPRGSDGDFPLSGALLTKESPFYVDAGDAITHLVPLVSYGRQGNSRVYEDRGVMTATHRYLRAVYETPDVERDDPHRVRVELPGVGKVLGIVAIPIPGHPLTVVAGVDDGLRVVPAAVYSVVGNRDDVGTTTSLDTAAILSGTIARIDGVARVTAMACHADGRRIILMVGCADQGLHRVEIRTRGDVDRESEKAGEDVLTMLGGHVASIQRAREILWEHPFSGDWKQTLCYLIEGAIERGRGQGPWRLALFEMLLLPGDSDLVEHAVMRLVRRQLGKRNIDLSQASISADVSELVLCGRTYSEKDVGLMELLALNRSRNPDDAIVYSSILAERGHDLWFKDRGDTAGANEGFGEVLAFSPLLDRPSPRNKTTKAAILTTRRGTVWRVMLDGRVRRIQTPPAFGGAHVVNLYFMSGTIVLSLSNGSLWTAKTQEIDSSATIAGDPFEVAGLPAGTVFRSFCPWPCEDRWESRRFLAGDRLGNIWVIHLQSADKGTARKVWSLDPAIPGDRTIHDIRSATLSHPESTPVPFVIACTGAGFVHLLAFPANNPQVLEENDRAPSDGAAITKLLWPGNKDGVFVSVSSGGQADCYRVVSGSGILMLRRRWSFRTDERIADVHEVPVVFGEGEQARPYPRILLGAHDGSFYVLDRQGRLRETIRLPDIRIHRFVPVLPPQGRPAPGAPPGLAAEPPILADALVADFEKCVAGVRILDRRDAIALADSLVSTQYPEMSDEELARLGCVGISEGYLRSLYFRRAAHLEQDFPTRILDLIERIKGHSHYGPRETDALCGLIMRLFHQATGARATRPGGLAHLLEDPRTYTRAMRSSSAVATQWGLPGSEENTRVQLCWIRSVLRSISGLETFERWITVGDQLRGEGQPDAFEAAQIALRFLTHDEPFVQYKTAQYLERLLFGWDTPKAGSTAEQSGRSFRGAALFDSPDYPTLVSERLRSWLFDVLAARLRWQQRDVAHTETYAFVGLEIIRLLAHALRRGLFCPTRMFQAVRGGEIPAYALGRLAEHLEASADESSALDTPLARWITAIDKLHGWLEERDYLHPDWGPHVAETLTSCLAAARGIAVRLPTVHVGVDAWIASHVPLIPFLALPSIGAADVLALSAVPSDSPPYLLRLARAAAAYYEAKHHDIGLRDFRGFRAGLFQALERAIDDASEEASGTSDQTGVGLRAAVARHWKALVERERNEALVSDFLATVKETLLDIHAPAQGFARNADGDARLEETSRTLRDAIGNLFHRLIAFAEPDRAVLLRAPTDPGAGPVSCLVAPPPMGSSELDVAPAEVETVGIPSAWSDPEAFGQLDSDTVMEHLTQSTGPEWVWEVETFDTHRFGRRVAMAFLAFGWSSRSSRGFQQYDRHRLLRDLVIGALRLQEMEVVQAAFVGAFYSSLAHDLRNPIAKLRSSVRVLEAHPGAQLDEEHRAALFTIVRRESARMAGIVDGLLALQRAGDQPTLVGVDVIHVVRDALKGCRVRFPDRTIDLDHGRLKSLELESVDCWLYEIVANLVENAIKYSTGRISVTVRYTRQVAHIEVVDSGIGVPKSERGRIFEPFYRGESVRKSKSGFGLGLFICKTYVDRLRGHIEVLDAEPRGARFAVSLPIHVPQPGRTLED